MPIALSLPGYARVQVGRARGLSVTACSAAIEAILANETLYAWAARQPDSRPYEGRAPVHGVSLDGCGDVVVRHAMRGGLLGRTGTDLFLPPTRGLRELINSLRLLAAGVRTPEVVAFVTYRVSALLRRSDVVTREVRDSHDLAVVLREMAPGPDRESCLRAAGALLAALTAAGAHHPDINAKNVLIAWETGTGAEAWVLDVDRIRFHVPGDPMVASANLERLERSLGKLRDAGRLEISAEDLALIRAAASESAE